MDSPISPSQDSKHWSVIKGILLQNLDLTTENVDALLTFHNIFADITKSDVTLQEKVSKINNIFSGKTIAKEDINHVLYCYLRYGCDRYLESYDLDIYHVRAWLALDLPLTTSLRLHLYTYVNDELFATYYDISWIKNLIRENNQALEKLPPDTEDLMGDDNDYLFLLDRFMELISQVYNNSNAFYDNKKYLPDLLAKVKAMQKELADISSFRSTFYVLSQTVNTDLEDGVNEIMGGAHELDKFRMLVENRVNIGESIILKKENEELQSALNKQLEYLDILKRILL
jgi:hypothetical protein